jgi:hypothetical protein
MTATATTESAFVSVKTAARVLGISEASVRRRIDDGPATRLQARLDAPRAA